MSLRPHVDLRTDIERGGTWDLPPIAQFGDDDCTSIALTSAVELLEWRSGRGNLRLSNAYLHKSVTTRFPGANPDRCTIPEGLRYLKKMGVCNHDLWPYRRPPFELTDPDALLESHWDAAGHRIKDYCAVPPGLENLRRALNDNLAIVFGHYEFGSDIDYPSPYREWLKNDDATFPMPRESEYRMGSSHDVLAIGYDDLAKAVLVRDCRGPQWKMEGHFWMPYDFIENPERATDFYVITGLGDESG